MLVSWLFFGLNGPLRQYFSLYRAVSQREGERGEKGKRRIKMSKPPPPAPTASAIGPCPTIIQIVGRPALEVYPAPSHHPTTPGYVMNYVDLLPLACKEAIPSASFRRITVVKKKHKKNSLFPAGTLRRNDVVLTSVRRLYVASTSIQRHFDVVCPLDCI